MDPTTFEQWLARLDGRTDAQRYQARTVLMEQAEAAAARVAVERNLGEDRCCPHCSTPDVYAHGYNRGLRRYRCQACRRTFHATTGTPLCGLHRQERWLQFSRSLAQGESVRRAA